MRRLDGHASVTTTSCRLVSGTTANGRYLSRLQLPACAQRGNWTVSEGRLTDHAGTWHTFALVRPSA